MGKNIKMCSKTTGLTV